MIVFSWLERPEVQGVISMIFKILDILRIVVPIGLIVMTTLDVMKKVINPEDKDGQKKIMIRAIAALIVFLIPTFIRIVFKIMDVDIDNLSIEGNSKIETSTPTPRPTSTSTIIITPTPTTSPKQDILNNLTITNCPSSSKVYNNADRIVLDTNIPSSYSGSIDWKIKDGNEFVDLLAYNKNTSAIIELSNITTKGSATIEVSAGGKKSTCVLNYDKKKLNSVSITTCPALTSYYYPGDKINLKTDIPNDFNEKIEWQNDNSTDVKLEVSSNKKEANVTILNQPQTGYFTVTVLAGSTAKTCLIKVSAVKELKITNCPSNSQVFNIGDRVELNTNLPTDYSGKYAWGAGNNNDKVNIVPFNNGRSAEIKILKSSSDGYIYVAVSADSDAKSASCKINIKNVTPTPKITPVLVTPTPVPTKKPSTSTPTASPTPTPTSTPSPTPSVKISCSPLNNPYLENASAQFCNDIYTSYQMLINGATTKIQTGRYNRYYGCIKVSSSGKYNVYECQKVS